MLKRVISITLIITLVLFAGSCIKDTLDMDRISKTIEINPGLAIPIGYGSITINDMLKRFTSGGLVKTDSSGLLYLTYSSDLISLDANTAVKIPDQAYNQFFIRNDIPVPVLIPAFDSVVLPPKVNNFAFNFGQKERIDSLVIKSGTLQFDFQSSFRNDGYLLMKSAGIITNGKPFSKKLKVSSKDGNFLANFSFDLSGSTILFNRSNDTSYIPFSFGLALSGSADTLRPKDLLKIGFSFINFQYKTIFGNIGYQTFLNQPFITPLSLFNPNFGGNISFVNPTLDITISNSIGLPIKLRLSDVNTFSAKTHGTTNITFPPKFNPISINYPLVTELGQTKTTVISFDSITPSMIDILKTSPSVFNFTAGAYSDTAILNQTNFITDTSKFKASVEVTLPMWFSAGDFSMEDTIAFDFSTIAGGGGELSSAMVRLSVNNGLPTNVAMQVYFADTTYHVLDSLFTTIQPVIASAIVDNATSKVITSTTKSSDATLDNAKVLKNKNTRWALVKASLTTAQYPGLKVKFYDYYKLGFNLYVKAQVKITQTLK